MAEDGFAQSAATWPVPRFQFSVEIADVGKISCKEVSGLGIEYDVIEYRSGDMPAFTKVKMPGLKKLGNVILKNAMFNDDKKLWNWINQANMNDIKPADVTISLLDVSASPVQSWKLANAWPKRYRAAGFDAYGNSVSMVTIEIAHEGISPA